MSDQMKEENDYLALRDAKIKRNNEKLEKLGLVNKPNSSHEKVNGNISTNNDGERKQKKSSMNSNLSLRRSSRRKSSSLSPSASQSELGVINDSAATIEESTKSKATRKRQRTSDYSDTKAKKSTLSLVRNEAKPGTTRATTIDIHRVLHGDFNYPIYIGHQLASSGKAAVVEHANLVCRNDFGISFNKYSGVCEWSNEAIFLWVNINAPNADVKNEFLQNDENGMQMSWFGGSRMKEESPSIQNLLLVGRKAVNNSNDKRDENDSLPKDCGIVLWCRFYDDKKKGFDPYVCLGRLSYHSHDPNVHPIKFIWNLMDYDVIKQNGIAYQTFQKMAAT